MPERLAWARREGVRPPAKVLAQAQRAGLDVSVWGLPARNDEGVKSLACRPVSSLAGESRHCCCKKSPVETSRKVANPPATPFSSFRAWNCQGLQQLWVVIAVAVPLVETMILDVDHPSEPFLVPAGSFSCFLTAPPTPPPESSRATLA